MTIWHLWHDTFPHFLYVVSPKEKKKKRNINNDLAILPSYDIIIANSLLEFALEPIIDPQNIPNGYIE